MQTSHALQKNSPLKTGHGQCGEGCWQSPSSSEQVRRRQGRRKGQRRRRDRRRPMRRSALHILAAAIAAVRAVASGRPASSLALEPAALQQLLVGFHLFGCLWALQFVGALGWHFTHFPPRYLSRRVSSVDVAPCCWPVCPSCLCESTGLSNFRMISQVETAWGKTILS